MRGCVVQIDGEAERIGSLPSALEILRCTEQRPTEIYRPENITMNEFVNGSHDL